MSFDLAVWYEPWPVTSSEARSKLDLAYDGDESAFIPHENVRAFRADLMERFPELEELGLDDDNGVWSVTPDDSDRFISMCMRYSKADEVIPVILSLADQYGLICLDPQDNSVYLPSSMGRTLHLTATGSPDLSNPEPDVITHRVRKALLRGGHAILERESERYVQAGSGAGVGMRQSGYAVEYRDGAAESHFRHETNNLDEVIAVFEAFARHDAKYQTCHPWQQYG